MKLSLDVFDPTILRLWMSRTKSISIVALLGGIMEAIFFVDAGSRNKVSFIFPNTGSQYET